MLKQHTNKEGETPYEAFDRSHANLVKEGEKWMKDIAQTSTIVGTLIITIMFAALFTVPGGPDQDTGVPLLLTKKLFKIFIISDSISLFASTTSVLIFVGILTSRYTAPDFLKSLPNKLIIGLSSLFISIVAMMVSFSSTVIIMLERLNLSFNRLQGEVPSSLGKLTSLDMLNLSNNHLQGELPSTFSGFPLSSFSGNDKLCGPPLSSCMDSADHEKNRLSNTAVICVIVAIVFTSTVICLVLIYIMLRIWCNWRKVSISNSEGAGIEQKREEEKWVYGDEKKRKGEYWRVNSMALVPS
ncbi:Leucine-rich repeat - like 10 [Theobroma cacao]|nr:Leucine-rich repeat - like 10 [Theobroma cacao]